MTRMSGRHVERKRSALNEAFVYFEGSERMGNEGMFVLGLESAIERLEAACQCRTWGEFARLSGSTWKAFVEERREELQEILGSRRPGASEPFDFAAMWEEMLHDAGFTGLTIKAGPCPSIFEPERI